MKLLRDENGQASAENLILTAAVIILVLLMLALILGAFEGGVTLTNDHSQAEVRDAINNGTQNLIT